MHWKASLVAVATLVPSSAAFFVFPEDVNATALARAYGIDGTCFAALNSTIDCHPATVARVHSPDDIYWTADNITKLCTSSCRESMTNWVSKATGLFMIWFPTCMHLVSGLLVHKENGRPRR